MLIENYDTNVSFQTFPVAQSPKNVKLSLQLPKEQ
jgi:hypothetical protein